jgi:heme exporter protein CcmD
VEFLDFGKYSVYVWSSFGLTLVVLVGNVITARRRLAGRIARLRRQFAVEETP